MMNIRTWLSICRGSTLLFITAIGGMLTPAGHWFRIARAQNIKDTSGFRKAGMLSITLSAAFRLLRINSLF
ncbi:MAG: hypothetical protein KKE44_20075 [Proteobacteria bacterium]|nr:hypothetical protein [Pseudomonadota bacterium]MBU1585030.1 hypothetical protein [Pseudomonadota bacterium]MBU2453740.1 hypothetical protein [Pseudomonadota bacterium]MBU2629035.1 hypothetical protein [Pseudomonadota bacterium]